MANACHDHIGGHLGSVLRDRIVEQGWLEPTAAGRFRLTPAGVEGLAAWGIDVRALLEDAT